MTIHCVCPIHGEFMFETDYSYESASQLKDTCCKHAAIRRLSGIKIARAYPSLRGSKVMSGCMVCGDNRESSSWECPGCGSI